MGVQVLERRRSANPSAAIFLLTDGVDQACRAVRCPHSVSCFGYGTGHDGKLLADIAARNEGSYYHIPDLDLVGEAFAQSLGELQSKAIYSVSLSLL